jgi:protein SCO1/2
MNARRLSLLAAAAAAVVGLGAVLLALLPGVGSNGGSGTALIGGPFALVDHTGRAVTEKDFAGKPMLVYFGYTSCPDVCPTELQNMSLALDALGEAAEEIQPVFITVDPARDTVPVLADYVKHFGPGFVGLTGSEEQVSAAAKAYRVYYARGAGDDVAYLMDHSSFVYLMGPDGDYLTHFAPNTPPEEMAQRIRDLI